MIEWLVYPVFWQVLSGALLVALLTGTLGCFVVWQRMAYFGATLAHTALLGVALGFLLGIYIKLAVALTAILMGMLLSYLRSHALLRQQLHNDVLLGFLAHVAMALGIVVLVALDDVRIDIFSYLFGDVLTLTMSDIYWLLAACLMSGAALFVLWRPLLMLTVQEELAQVEGIRTEFVRFGFVILLAFVVALAMQFVGALLVTSFLIIPAASARRFAKTPMQMVYLSVLLASMAVLLGVMVSFAWNIPAGPATVVVMAAGFILSWLMPVARD